MKALSLRQPWADMVALGPKTVETRRWATRYRGPLLIVSSRRPPGPRSGFALAVCDLVDCRPMTPGDEAAACCPVYPGAVAFVLERVTPIDPFPVRGRLGLFEVDFEDPRRGRPGVGAG